MRLDVTRIRCHACAGWDNTTALYRSSLNARRCPPYRPRAQGKVASPSSSEPQTFAEEKFAPPPMPESFKSH